MSKYKWSGEVEAVARAIAAADGWELGNDAYNPVAVAAIEAYKSAYRLELGFQTSSSGEFE